MTFDQMLDAGRAMTPQQVEETVRQLARDERLVAILSVIDRDRHSMAVATAKQEMARDHGKLAHSAGSLYAFQLLLDQFRNLIEPPLKRVPQKPPE